MKILLIICDGMGDRLTEGKTPLEVAQTPNMDELAQEGICGIMDTVGEGVRPGSDTAHLSLLGYDPYEVYTGRGAFEAYGVNLELQKGEVAFRCNFGTIEDGKVKDRRAGREEYGLEKIASELDGREINGVQITFKKAEGHRAVLILKGKNLSSRVSDVDPHEPGIPPKKSRPLDDKEDSKKTCAVLNKFIQKSQEILEGHPVNEERKEKGLLPANLILARGAGTKPDLKEFSEKQGMEGASISGDTIIMGVSRAVGLKIIEVKGATGHLDSNIGGKRKAALKALQDHDFLLLHIKGTDEASHDGDFEGKVKMIERIDKEVIGPILENIEDTTVALTADHSTPLSIQEHSADPVPIAIWGDVRTDGIKEFSERKCAQGGLNRICCQNLMGILMDVANKIELFGA